MKFIGILISLLIVGLLINKQLEASKSMQQSSANVPASAQDLEKLEQDINNAVLESAEQQKVNIDRVSK